MNLLCKTQLKEWLFLSTLLLFSSVSFGQEIQTGNISGSFQSDVQYLFPDSVIGADAVDENILSNSFLQLTYQKGRFSAGLRYEAYLNPLLGFDLRYKEPGQGLPYRYASYQGDKIEVTVGNFYDQFGTGLIFRAYQEWTLGIDNSIDGLRVKFNPVPGFYIKGIIGKQRKFFELSEGILRGADTELQLNEIIPALEESKTRFIVGGSVMSKYQKADEAVTYPQDPAFQYVLPENVTAFSARARMIRGGFNLDAEYAYKINDPFQLNNYVYNSGNGLYVNANYSQKGLGINVSAKRIDNMDFRSERTVTLQELSLSFIPPISRLHTYRLPTLYPYATQLNGEVGIQGSLIYTIPRKTKLGGKYGTQISVNYSRVHGLDTTFVNRDLVYETSFLGDPSNLFFQDINVEINRRWTKNLRTILTYIYFKYNMDVLATNTLDKGMLEAHIAILEAQYKISRKVAIRGELQHMYAKKDMGSWVMALAELSISPNWYFTVIDEYNYGHPDPTRRVHYYNLSAAYAFKTHRIALAYSRQRSGLLCVGGICREVPASNGFGISITSSF